MEKPDLTIKKKCSKCGVEKSLIEFGRNGTSAKCKVCYDEYNRKWREQNRNHIDEYGVQHRRKISNTVTPTTNVTVSLLDVRMAASGLIQKIVKKVNKKGFDEKSIAETVKALKSCQDILLDQARFIMEVDRMQNDPKSLPGSMIIDSSQLLPEVSNDDNLNNIKGMTNEQLLKEIDKAKDSLSNIKTIGVKNVTVI